MRRSLLLLLIAAPLYGQDWPQWGRDAQHHGSVDVAGRKPERIETSIVLDPFAAAEEAEASGNLLAHYSAPLVEGNDLYVVVKGGAFSGLQTRETQTWNIVNLRRVGGELVTRWTYESSWKPVPWGSASWEPVYHPALTSDALFAPALGGGVDKIDRQTGQLLARFNPFGPLVDATIVVAGPLTIDERGNVYYNVIQLTPINPWANDPAGSWLVRIGADGTVTKATFASLIPNAPDPNALCTTSFAPADLPFPPAPDAVAPATRCSPQRPGMNVAPAVADDGTIYTISRAHLNDRWAFLVAVNPNLTPKWAAALRNRLTDGCNVTIPQNGTPGGCRSGAITGVDPAENQRGSGRVLDNATSSPVVLPDGRIVYGAYTRYNYSQGHLMMFGADGSYIGAYGWGWDLTPAIYQHSGTYSILLKENHYSGGSYCNDNNVCPPDRTMSTPADPEQYFITQLGPSLQPEWKFRSTNTLSCERRGDGTVECRSDHPNGFEWCVNAVAVDGLGVVYANSEDGNLYAIAQGGVPAGSIFLRLAVGAAYTPTSIGGDGRLYTQNDGKLFIIGDRPRRRAVRQR